MVRVNVSGTSDTTLFVRLSIKEHQFRTIKMGIIEACLIFELDTVFHNVHILVVCVRTSLSKRK